MIVEWQRIDAATANSMFSGRSFTVLAEEEPAGRSTPTPKGAQPSAGSIPGALDAAALGGLGCRSLVPHWSGRWLLTTNGLSTGYFASDTYNALNYKISSNEGDGLVRNFGVDANGNVVETDLLGDPNNASYNPANPITTYTTYDGRNRKVASFGAPVAVGGSSAWCARSTATPTTCSTR